MPEHLRIVGLVTSARPRANTEYMVQEALQASERLGLDAGLTIQTEVLSLAGKRILPCNHCDACSRNRTYCVLDDDWLAAVRKLVDPPPDGLIVGSPVFFMHGNALGRAFMERCTCLLKRKWDPGFPYAPPDLSTTVAGAVAVGTGRHSGIEHTLSDILDWFLVMGAVVVGGWNLGAGGWTRGDSGREAVKGDRLGLAAARKVGQRVARTAILLSHGKESVSSALPAVSLEEIVHLNSESESLS